MKNSCSCFNKTYSAILFLLLLPNALFAENLSIESNSQWPRSHANYQSNKYSEITQISKSNIKNLKKAWEWSEENTNNKTDTSQVNPIFFDSKLFSTTLSGFLIAINPESGKLIWKNNLGFYVGKRGLTGSDILIDKHLVPIVFTPTVSGIHAINAQTGKAEERIGNKGVFGKSYSVVAPIIDRKYLITATMDSKVEKFDLQTGKKIWELSLVEPKIKSLKYYYNLIFKNKLAYNASVWSGISFDPDTKTLYINTGNPNPSSLLGIKRPGDNLYSNSIVAIDTLNGSIKWAVQTIKHDLWDYDVVGPPILTKIEHKGKMYDAVISLTKRGDIYLINSINGEILNDHAIVNTPSSEVEQNSPNQITLNWPQRFTENIFNKNQINSSSPDNEEFIKHKIRNVKYGDFLPPSINYPVVTYGLHGGPEWPGASFDPKNKILALTYNQIPWILRLEYREKKKTINISKYQDNALYQKKCSACHGEYREGFVSRTDRDDKYFPSLVGFSMKHKIYNKNVFMIDHKYSKYDDKDISEEEIKKILNYLEKIDTQDKLINNIEMNGFWEFLLDKNMLPANKPPWGGITAIDMKSGKLIFNRPFGSYDGLIYGKKVVGQQNFGGAIITESNLIFATGTVDKKIYALDEFTGKELWSYRLPISGSAPPMTFMLKNEQYIVVNCTGGRYLDFDKNGSKLIAFKLR